MATKPKPNPKLNPPRPKANPARAASNATAAMQAAKNVATGPSPAKGQLTSRTPATKGKDSAATMKGNTAAFNRVRFGAPSGTVEETKKRSEALDKLHTGFMSAANSRKKLRLKGD